MSSFENINGESKQRLPLSDYAAATLESDCVHFAMKKSTLVNAIILNYSPLADCSIGFQLRKYEEELWAAISPIEKHKYKDLIKQLVDKKKKSLENQYTHLEKTSKNWVITLNNAVMKMLTEDPSSSEEKYYGTRPGVYIRALAEEYCRLPFFQREAVIFHSTLKVIQDQINLPPASREAIKIEMNQGKQIIIKPYRILSDPLSMYHYVVGYNLTPDDPNPGKPKYKQSDVLSIRLSRITQVKSLANQTGALTSAEEKAVKEKIRKLGVQFVGSEASLIRLWLSDEGIRQFNKKTHLRPFPIANEKNTDEHIFTFDCTPNQIQYFFINFGKDVKILEPKSLRDRFEKIYREALSNYEDKD